MPSKKDKNIDLQAEIDKSVKLFDVAKPGESAPSPTSRPLIVGHQKMVARDPMVKDDKEQADETKEETKLQVHRTPVVEPVSIEVKKEEPAKPATDAAPADPEPDNSEKDPSAPEEHAAEDEAVSKDAAAVETIAKEANAKNEKKQEDKAAAERIEAVRKSIETKEFYLPIGEAQRRSHNRIAVTILLLLVVALVCLNFALDAEMLDIGIEPLTNLL